MPDQALRPAGPVGGLRFAAQRDRGEAPQQPRRRMHLQPARSSSASLRPNATVNGLKPPAWLLVVPAVKDG